ncbi:MAG TPA: tRNA (adenosine(37)-N6)-threonylcarbamoyltransferase complex dimerization subunit type 1 TsaB [Saprospiraceae bacterium]|nr:tRNA (adenosine(37)-N6)-threonylcarbamoyltransferase complex dimerization subunit type 1 TsaB [Saprospiraceae bacterium]
MVSAICIESSTKAISLAIFDRSSQIVFERSSNEMDPVVAFAVWLEEAIQSNLINPSALDYILVSKGPGSFTGLRAGMAFAKGLAYGWKTKILAVSSLQSIAALLKRNHPEAKYYIPMIDARRNEVYTGVYDIHLQSVMTDQALDFDQGIEALEPWIKLAYAVGGDGAVKFELKSDITVVDSKAEGLYRAAMERMMRGEFDDLSTLRPSYLKEPNITTAKKKLHN